MSNVNALLNERMKKNKNSNKIAALAIQSAEGNRNGFAGIFGTTELSPSEKEILERILNEYSDSAQDIEDDLKKLLEISAEVKAINHQAALLHGERIKKAHRILTHYREGAFTAWLLATYGNRQTPYNFFQFYEFYTALPNTLHPTLEIMPRQAIYTLASREGDFQKKQTIIEQYNGETKDELLEIIREAFPLRGDDRRRRNRGETILHELKLFYSSIAKAKSSLTKKQKSAIQDLLSSIQEMVSDE